MTHFHTMPGVHLHTHPRCPGVTMLTDKADPFVKVVCQDHVGRTITANYSRKYAARLLQFWRASK